MTRTRYVVTTRPWGLGWELEVPEVGETQSRSLAAAEDTVRAYVADKLGVEPDSFEVVIAPMIDGELADRIEATRKGAAELLAFQKKVNRRAIDTATALENAGYKRKDIAALMGVSDRRISQLLPRKHPVKR